MVRYGTPMLAAALLSALVSSGFADGTIRDGIGARSIGRGGTNIAHSDNGVVLHDNPAGMMNVSGRGLADAGFDLLLTNTSYSDPANPSAVTGDGLYPLGQVALIRKGPRGDWAYGVGLFAPAGFGTRYTLEGPPPFGGPRLYNAFGAMAKILPGVAHRLTDRLSVGATLGVGIAHMELEAPYTLQGAGPLLGTPTLLDLQATGATITWSAGLQYQWTDATTLGLVYQSETRFKLDGSTQIEVPGFGQSRYDSQLDVTWPRSVGLGVRHELCPHRVLSADVIWYNWSKAFDELGVGLSNATNPLFPAIKDKFLLDWRDTVSVRLGYEQIVLPGFTMRFGYSYNRNPVPDRTLTPFLQTTLEHAFSTGCGWQRGDWEIDLAYQFSFGSDRAVGTSDWVGGDFDNSLVESQAHWIAMSFLRKF